MKPAVFLLTYTYLDGWDHDQEVNRHEVYLGDYLVAFWMDPLNAEHFAKGVAELHDLQLFRRRRRK